MGAPECCRILEQIDALKLKKVLDDNFKFLEDSLKMDS